jgi:hypothetical protein
VLIEANVDDWTLDYGLGYSPACSELEPPTHGWFRSS